ncbi:MAG: D-amino acid dehydrogenase [Ramlibacter sp.]
MKSVCIIGAGVVGCATAYQLSRAGCKVHLVDAHAGPAQGASRANGAQLSYSYVEPLASPATLKSLPSLLLARSSPLRFKPRLDWQQWQWGIRFLAACTRDRAAHGTRTLLQLAALSRATLDQWREDEALAFSHASNGKLVLCRDNRSLQRQREQVELQASFGSDQRVLSREECLAQEPALEHSAIPFAGGIWTPDECLADPYELCHELVRCLGRDGAQLHFGCHVTGFVQSSGRVTAVRTTEGELHADDFVIAAGAQSVSLGKALGISWPVYPIKGYSLTLPVVDASRAPRASVTDLGLKTVFAPLRDQLRVAAMAEVVGHELSIPPSRIRAMLDSVEKLFPGACDLAQPQPWAGLRPATPDSLPIIGPTRIPNVHANVGHGALGFTLAAGSAVVLARQLTGIAPMQRKTQSLVRRAGWEPT